MQFHVENMTCDGCVRSVTKAIQKVDPAAGVKADLASRNIEVASSASRERVVDALAKAGYEAA